jgi:hypothetical protein
MRRLAGAELAQRTEEILSHDEWGCALYKRYDGAKFVISYGNRFAEFPGQSPPSNWGDSLLDSWVPPEPPENEMISPLKKALQNPAPQIARPKTSAPRTDYPEVWLTGR